MCGIAGLVNVNNASDEHGRIMIDKIRYRGVDEFGVESVDSAIMAHARLAVVDPENGKQPMTNEDETVWVTFNGEIYNYVELREELMAKGHKFKSRCDTEVLVHLWEEMGEKMLDRLIGMFAFFLWDRKTKTGILVRDRLGVKPCFYTKYEGGWAFASEMKSILALPEFKKEINYNQLRQVFAFNYAPPPQTCFKNIQHLEPGTYLHFKGKNPPVQKKYWEWPFRMEKEDVPFEQFSSLIDDAVRLQMRFDVPGGLYLSGGVDSTVVAHHLKKQWKEKVLNGLGLNFNESKYSEYAYSEEAASLLNVKLSDVPVGWEIIPEIAEKVAYHTEQPHGDFSFFLFYQLANRANQDGKIVMFTGDGPDEVLSGFSHNEKFFHSQQRMNFAVQNYFEIISYMDPKMAERLLNRDLLQSADDPLSRFQALVEPWSELEPIEQIAAYECTSLMPGNNLVKGDRMGAAWSTEGRAPFLDHRIIELMVRLPVTQKYSDGVGKYYLKKYAERLFPRQFIYRHKTMPTTPIGEWLKGPLYEWAVNLFGDTGDGVINSKECRELLRLHKAGEVNYTKELRTLLMTALWLRVFDL